MEYDAFSKINQFRRLLRDYLPVNYEIPFTNPGKKRDLDIFLRTSRNLPRETVAFHRQELVRRLDAMLQRANSLTGSVKGKIPLKKYMEMMKNSKITFGPFGWGELNIREYEAYICGTLLLRPDISHMETWPSIFVAGETYQPYRWDFEDLESTIKELLKGEGRRLQIARSGQEAYRDSISPLGMERFCGWFIQQIDK